MQGARHPGLDQEHGNDTTSTYFPLSSFSVSCNQERLVCIPKPVAVYEKYHEHDLDPNIVVSETTLHPLAVARPPPPPLWRHAANIRLG